MAKTSDLVTRDRRAMLAKVHIAKKDLALTDESYADTLERITGKRSAADCDDPALDRVLAEFVRLGWKPKHKRGRRRKEAAPAVRPRVAKIRALWRALHNLGEVVDPSDAALSAFVRRQTDLEALEWMTSALAYKVIEALKAWCGRAGFEVPQGGLEAKRALLRAQWKRLDDLGELRIAESAALDSWLQWKVSGHAIGVELLDPGHCDAAADRLGRWIRDVKKEAAP